MGDKTAGDRPTVDELRGLLGGPPEDFVRQRTVLAARLKSEGRVGAAAAVKALRRPPLSAWVTNQLSARAADEVARLLDAGGRLRRAQLALASGDDDRAAFAAASSEQRALVAALIERARALLEEGGHAATPATLERVARNLRAAATSEDAAAAIGEGRLDADLEAQDFSALLASVAGAPARAPAAAKVEVKPAAAKTAAAAAGEAAEDRRRREREEAAAEERAAAARVREAEKAARAEVAAAQKELARAEQRRGRATAAVETARAALREAEAEAEAADTAARRARGVLAEAEAILRRGPGRIVT